jgi:hypothetical protein
MFGKNPRMNTLATRKQLLLAESELNRVQLGREMAELRAGIRTLTGRAQSFTSIVSSVAVLVSALATFRRSKSADAGAKPSWPQTILKGAGLISSLWLAFRSQERDHKDK